MRDIIVWVEDEEDYGIMVKMDDVSVWVKLRNSEEVVTLAHHQIEVLTEEEIEELENDS